MEPQLILLSIIRDYPALVVLILSLQAIVRIVTTRTDPGKLGKSGLHYSLLHIEDIQ